MFPATCAALREAGVEMEEFVTFWRHSPRRETGVFDFFLIKIDRFLEFVESFCPSAGPVAQEAIELRRAYEAANVPAPSKRADA
ncbi:MAG: hypothetical protein U0361_20185 [Nitrospiraceae bacterium]